MRLAVLAAAVVLCLVAGCGDDPVKPRFGSTGAKTVLVRPDGSGDYATIQDAIDAASDGDIILLADGVYRGPGNRDLDYLGRAITIRSKRNSPDNCTIDCESTEDELHNGFLFHSGETEEAVLQAVRVENGEHLEGGGAVRCVGSSPTFVNVVFANNTSGAVHLGYASPSFYRCQFLNNADGGLLALNGPSTPSASSTLLVECAFRGNYNSWGNGGAIYNLSNNLTAIRCVFRGNEVKSTGGAIRSSEFSVLRPSSLRLFDCWFEENRAEEVSGGALNCSHGRVLIEGCTFVGNYAGSYGGGAIRFLNRRDDVVVRGSTFYGNNSVEGAAIKCTLGSSPQIESSIIAFNRGSAAIVCDTGSAPVVLCSNLFGNEGGDWTGCIEERLGAYGNVSANPLFCDAVGGNLRLRADSPSVPRGFCGQVGAWRIGCPLKLVGNE